VPVKGYFHWSSMDDVGWFMCVQFRFELFLTEMKTLERTPKLIWVV
jgi:beta-glucosidase/6-phospho-beta-glucosidase/beta-galactosidase